MAIGTDCAIEYFGTQDTVTAGGGTSAVSDAAFSASGDVVSGGWTNDDNAPMAAFVLKWQYASGTLNTYGEIHLYARPLNIQSTNDPVQPDGDYPFMRIGSFLIDDALATSTDQYAYLRAELPNMYASTVYEFYLLNDTGVTMAAGWVLYTTPVALGPAA